MKKLRRSLVRRLDRIPRARLLLTLFIARRLNPTGGAELIVEGFPRSGNTFFYGNLKAQAPSLRVSHHTHLVANVERAKRRNIAAVILFREPVEAVASLVAKCPSVYQASQCLDDYVHFYSSALKLIPDALFVNFETLVKFPDSVLNATVRHADINLYASATEQAHNTVRKNATKNYALRERLARKLTAEPEMTHDAKTVYAKLESVSFKP